MLDANSLKDVVRDSLMAMSLPERDEFIRTLETEARRVNVNLRAYLVPIGIPGRSTEDMTPTEIGHLARFLKINVPKAMAALERAMAHFPVFAEKMSRSGHPLAA